MPFCSICTICSIKSLILSILKYPIYSLPTSLCMGILLANTGNLLFKLSIIGSPNPSIIDGNRSIFDEV